MKVTGKTALVAGGTRGIGLAIARKLATKGARVIVPWHDWPEDSRRIRKEFRKKGAHHIFVRVDLRDRDAVRDFIARIKRDTPGLDILINNIERGGMPVVHGPYERKVNRKQWQLELDTTLLAKKNLFETALPLLRRTREAVVINITSIAALTGRSGPAGLLYSDGYAAANRAASGFTETWARAEAPGIRVHEIMLGLIDTRHGKKTRGWQALSGKERKKLLAHTLAGRTGRPEEVARTALFLIRNGSYMTGSVIRMDGGYMLGGDRVPPVPGGIL